MNTAAAFFSRFIVVDPYVVELYGAVIIEYAAAVLGGSIGAMIGMAVFRHKTLHSAFRYGMPAILVLQLAVVWIAVRGI